MNAADSDGLRRDLGIQGAYNVRDLGGYKTLDGRSTRWGQYVRSDTLANLPASSVDKLVEYGIRNIIDLRRSGDLQFRPSPFIGSKDVAYYHQNMAGDVALTGAEDTEAIEDWTLRRGLVYVRILDQRQHIFHQIFSLLAGTDGLPALVHCNAGKDRAGLAAALMLSVCGVPRETIIQDYTLTAQYLVRRYYADNPEIDPSEYTWQNYEKEVCASESMGMALSHLDATYGGMREYLLRVGVTEAQMDAIRKAMVE